MGLNYGRIMALGSWLNRFLVTPLSPYDIEELADDALKLLNIDYVRSTDDPLIKVLTFILSDQGTLARMKIPAEALAVPVTLYGIDIKKYASPTT